jgi:uncharacterized protein YrrD
LRPGLRDYAPAIELGNPIAYAVLPRGTPVYSADGEVVGTVAHVLAAEDKDVFDGIVIDDHLFGQEHRFADADDIDRIYEKGVVLKLDRAACEQLPRPSANPAVMRVDPAESNADVLGDKLKRAWDRITGNY